MFAIKTMMFEQDSHNLLRPESTESLFVMWRVTGDPLYREWGWLMFRAWEKFCRVSTGGYTSLESVLQVSAIPNLSPSAAETAQARLHEARSMYLWMRSGHKAASLCICQEWRKLICVCTSMPFKGNATATLLQ